MMRNIYKLLIGSLFLMVGCGDDDSSPVLLSSENGKFIDDGRMKRSQREIISVGFVVCDDKYNIKRIVYSTYQAVSGAGLKALNDYKNGIKKQGSPKLPLWA